jgi:hypothetical protein
MNIGHQLGTAVREAVREHPPSGFWHQIGEVTIERVRTVVEELDPVRHEVWETRDDERTCAICGQLDGLVWPGNEGFMPPLHDHCRCTRAYHHTEFRHRLIEQWRDVAVTRTSWEWVHTT